MESLYTSDRQHSMPIWSDSAALKNLGFRRHHLLVQPEQPREPLLVALEGLRPVAALHRPVISAVGLPQVIRHLVWIVARPG